MSHFREQFWFPDETLAANERADIFPRNSNIHAPIWSDAAMTIPMANPTATDGSGFLDFYADTTAVPGGVYWIFIKGLDFERAINDGNDLTAGSFVKQYVETIGDGINTSYVVTHNLGNNNPQHTVEDALTNESVTAAVTHTSADAITVTFNDVAGVDEYVVSVQG
jgi:hypothetical protein